MQRITRHFVLFLLSCVTAAGFYLILAPDDLIWWLSMASAYGSLVLLALSLMIGPWYKLRGRPNPVSGYLRRDIGIWAGILGIVHVVAGLQVHMGGKILLYFLPPGLASFPFPLRVSQWIAFGSTNYLGLGATLVLLLLLSLSNDASLRAFGASRWKSLQRWNYAGALLVVAHGVIYQIIEKRTVGLIVTFAAIVLFALGMQFAGFSAVRKQEEKT
jgi:methionine sulfoxide reductase heme-binding subunit